MITIDIISDKAFEKFTKGEELEVYKHIESLLNSYSEMNDVIITPPEGYEIDKENSTFECIKFKPKEVFTYDDIAKKLFLHKETYFIGISGNIVSTETVCNNYSELNNAVSKKQCERLLAINQLMNVAYYFNEIVDEDITPSYRYIIVKDAWDGVNIGAISLSCKSGLVWFKTRESAEKAVKILGKETIRLAISL